MRKQDNPRATRRKAAACRCGRPSGTCDVGQASCAFCHTPPLPDHPSRVCGRCRADPASGYIERGAADLVHPAQIGGAVLARYYRLLNQNDDFATDLLALKSSIRAELSKSVFVPAKPPAVLEAFVEKWHLPAGRGVGAGPPNYHFDAVSP